MGGKHSRNKGASWERTVADLFRALTGSEHIRRGRQDNKNRFVGNAHESDIVGVPGLWIEAKHTNGRTAPGTWWAQACRDADGTGLEPVVVFKWDRGPVLVMHAEEAWHRWLPPGIARSSFSLTRQLKPRVRWSELPLVGRLRMLAVPLSPPVVIGHWAVFEELWGNQCRGS